MSTEFDQQRLRNEFTVPTPNTELHLQQSVKTTQQTVDSMNHVQFYKKRHWHLSLQKPNRKFGERNSNQLLYLRSLFFLSKSNSGMVEKKKKKEEEKLKMILNNPTGFKGEESPTKPTVRISTHSQQEQHSVNGYCVCIVTK